MVSWSLLIVLADTPCEERCRDSEAFVTKDYPHEQLIDKQLAKMGIACKRGQTVNLLDTQIGLVKAGLGIAVIPSFGVLASRNRKVRIMELEPVVTLEFHEISNRGRKLPAEAIEFGAFLKTYIARRLSDRLTQRPFDCLFIFVYSSG
jgi:DNA-binding transcriptional LysR family regulator